MAAVVLDTSDAISTAPPVQVQVISQWETALQSMVEEKHHKKHHRGAENAAAPAHAVDVRVECEEVAAETTPLLTASRTQQLEQKLLKGERVRAVWGIVTVGILVAPACACALFALLFPALLPSCLAIWAIVEVRAAACALLLGFCALRAALPRPAPFLPCHMGHRRGACCSLRPAPCALLARCSLRPAPCALLLAPCLRAAPCALLLARCSFRAASCALLARCSLRAACSLIAFGSLWPSATSCCATPVTITAPPHSILPYPIRTHVSSLSWLPSFVRSRSQVIFVAIRYQQLRHASDHRPGAYPIQPHSTPLYPLVLRLSSWRFATSSCATPATTAPAPIPSNRTLPHFTPLFSGYLRGDPLSAAAPRQRPPPGAPATLVILGDGDTLVPPLSCPHPPRPSFPQVVFVAIRYQELRRASDHRPELPLPSLGSVSDLLGRILKLK
ncbi:unnamed protein product [Closterium sp. NIES-64]|nr:unnamed protein product [Closterium sp. NIES-64]